MIFTFSDIGLFETFLGTSNSSLLTLCASLINGYIIIVVVVIVIITYAHFHNSIIHASHSLGPCPVTFYTTACKLPHF